MTQNIEIKQQKLCDVDLLHKFCCEVYSQNFSSHWNEGGLEDYLEKVFGTGSLKAELSGSSVQYYMAFANQEPVGFMKLNLWSNLPGLDIEKGMEIDKVYILQEFKGMKIGKRLLDVAFDIAKINTKEICWLSVIDTNLEAISFYEKAGFKFHSRTLLNYPKFREELKGMWRMYLEIV